jgi:hypothetical protein
VNINQGNFNNLINWPAYGFDLLVGSTKNLFQGASQGVHLVFREGREGELTNRRRQGFGAPIQSLGLVDDRQEAG